MSNYREQVQRVLAIHHARMELGLSKAREQEPFVARVAACFTRHQVAFKLGLNQNFDVCFRLPENIIHAENLLRTLFSGCLVERCAKGWILSDERDDALQVLLKSDDDDGL